MTYTEEYLPDEGLEQDDFSNYPTAFGITFTPKVTGIACGVLGLLASLYLATQWVLPAYNEYQKLKADERSKQQQVEQAKSGDTAQKFQSLEAQLQEKEAQKAQVLAMFADEENLDTILIDVSGIAKARNVELKSLQPQGEPTIVSDSSLGEAVNNKLKRQSYNLQMTGGFEQTQAVIRDLERLQPLILLKNFNTQIQEGSNTVKVVSTGQNQARLIPQDKQRVSTSFTMDVIVPLSSEELAKLAPPPPPPEQQPSGEQQPQESK